MFHLRGIGVRWMTRRTTARILIGIAAALVVFILFYAYQFVIVGTAYTAHLLCSGVFVSERSPESVVATDLTADDLAPLRYLSADVGAHRVTASFHGLAPRTAFYRDGLGCVIADDEPPSPRAWHDAHAIVESRWPGPPPGWDGAVLERALDWAFAEPDPARMRRTRAVVVVQDGRLLAERYADGVGPDTRLLGWSMGKSIVNALAGILVKRGALSLDAPLPVDAWPGGDPRHAITLGQMLRMSSGLDFDEDSIDPRGGVLYMLLRAPDVPAYAASATLGAPPGTHWSYSSATTNIITGAMRRVVGDAEYATFPRRALFDRIGVSRAVMETDGRDNFIGSSFVWATARDWARFGALYANDGVWGSERILPEGWVAYSRTPAPADAHHRYGAHFWLKIADNYQQPSREVVFPPDAFHAVGHEGQFLTIIPSQRLVIVRLGLTRHAGVWDQREFVRRILEGIRRRSEP